MLFFKITWPFDQKIHIPLTLKNLMPEYFRCYMNYAYYLMDNHLRNSFNIKNSSSTK